MEQMNIVTYSEAIKLLRAGKVGVMPTDTVYGLVARAQDQSAVTRMYKLKLREQKPGTLIAAHTDQLIAIGVDQSEIDKVSQWWPNPLSAVLSVHGNEFLHQDVGTLAMRVVANDAVRELLVTTGPLMTSSANQPGQPPATSVDEAFAYFGDSIDFYVDGGTIDGILPSTIIRPTDSGVEVLRQGSVTL